MSAERATPHVAVERVTLRYGGAARAAVDDVSFAAERGEVLTLLGPSGCGKTTALRIVAGLERPDAGSVRLGGDEITSWPPERRRMGFVFQNYALFPHLSVFRNVAFGLEVRKRPKAEIARAVGDALALVDLAGYESRRVDQMSGGQQQRVALARALAIEPEVLLLDEPLSNLDASLRESTRDALRDVLERLEVTTFFVTHDQAEAFAFSDRVVLMREGRIVEVGPPERLYRAPETPFAADFLGAANLLGARRDGDRVVVESHPTRPLEVSSWSAAAASANGDARLLVVARPESLTLETAESADALPGRVVDAIFLGASYRATVAIGDGDETVRVATPTRPVEGPVWVRFARDAVRVIASE